MIYKSHFKSSLIVPWVCFVTKKFTTFGYQDPHQHWLLEALT
jgi:hypothetical protein